MLPLSLLKTAQGHQMLIELKNGDTYNGQLVNCDTWMNVNLRDVICTSKDGDRFWKMPECYIRGNTVKYIRVPNEIIDMVNEEELSRRERQAYRGRGRGGRGGLGGPGRGGRSEGGRGGERGGRGREGGGRGRSGGRGRDQDGSRGRGNRGRGDRGRGDRGRGDRGRGDRGRGDRGRGDRGRGQE